MEANEKSTVKGLVDNITYTNPDNGYTICSIDCEGEQITLVGCIPGISEGEYIFAEGKWVNHPTYGEQFSVDSYRRELPATTEAILSYLSSGVIKGIGPVTAKRIVDKFGEDTLKVIEEHPEYLSDIKGISPKRVTEISESFRNQYGMRQVMLYFEGMLSPRLSLKAYKKWGNASVDVLKSNPYLLCEELDGIGFEKADAMAMKIGFANDSSERISAGIKYMLSLELNRNGHCCVPLSTLLSRTSMVLQVSREEIEEVIAMLSQCGELVAVKSSEGDIQVYLENVYRTEKYCAEKMLLLDEAASNIPIENIEEEIDKVENESGIQFAPLQRVAIKNSVTRGVVVVTGGPGTGKTTVIRAIIALLQKIDVPFCLAAPTGRAAKRMSAATGYKASTIHRLLECKNTGGDEDAAIFGRDEDNLLDEEAIIIDEASMVDVFLFCSLLRAIRPGARLIIIGDADQLSPVGAGEVFSDVIKSDCFMSVRLNDIFRQAQGSSIVTNAHLIKDGKMPVTDNKGDYFFLQRNKSQELRQLVVELCTQRLPKAYGFDCLSDIQIICPTRKGEAGTVSLNALMQGILNPPAVNKFEPQVGETVFRRGDKIMAVRNNYDIEWQDDDGKKGCGIFNGDIGIIEEIDKGEQSFSVRFDDGRQALLDFSSFDDVEHAYAITVHKSQGSEYKSVIIPLMDCPPGLLSRNMLYTAVTRAEKLAILAGRSETISEMVSNARRNPRYTGLCRMLVSVKNKRYPQNDDNR